MTLIAPRTARRRTSAAGRAQDAFATVFLSELGWIALAFRGETLAGLTFGQATGRDALAALRRVLGDSPVECVEREACRGTIRDVVDRLERYAAGEAVEFRRVAIDQSHLTPFARRVVAACRRIPAGQVINLEPGLLRDSLVESAIFFDGRVHSARYVLENLQEARSHGAVTLNYCAAVGWTRNTEGFWEVRLRDELDGAEATCRARKLVNTTGAWQSSAEGRLRLVRGSHLILPRVTSSENAIAYFEPAGRIIFFIPWGERNDLTLLGTTDVDHPGGADDVRISAEEVRYLLDIAATLFPKSRSLQPVSAYSSLRPLLDDGSGSATSTSREHRIWNDAQGILHVAGGKYTTYRAMSEEAVDQIAAEIAPHLEAIHATATTPLNGNSRQNVQAVQDDLPPEWRALLLPYGTGAARIVRRLGSVREEGGLEALERARILEAIETDQAETLADLVFTSTYWGYERTWTAAALLPYAEAMADHLAWPAGRAGAEVRRVLDQVALPDLAGKT